jgi:hypothetical protein
MISLFMVRFISSFFQIEASDYREKALERLSLFSLFFQGLEKTVLAHLRRCAEFPKLGNVQPRMG